MGQQVQREINTGNKNKLICTTHAVWLGECSKQLLKCKVLHSHGDRGVHIMKDVKNLLIYTEILH